MEQTTFMHINNKKKLTDFMEKGPSWEVNNSTAEQEISLFLWNLKDNCHVQKCPLQTVPQAFWIQSALSHPVSIILNLKLSSYLHLGLLVISSCQVFQLKFCTHFSFPSCMPDVQPISSSMISWPNKIMWRVNTMK